ncbi:hypothetical protein AA313_de0202898 [Arthrobotrys entomopaga]|nr:hypothetical protein AA313_de0202898 [Arthrobotrys entomopaga]
MFPKAIFLSFATLTALSHSLPLDQNLSPRVIIPAPPSCNSSLPPQCETNNLIFTTPLSTFITSYRDKNTDSPPLIYTSDGCSVPASVASLFHINKDEPYGFQFLNSCYRHDFSYRNFQAQERWTEPNRKLLDERFHADLVAQCGSQFPKTGGVKGVEAGVRRDFCKAVAGVYFSFVRMCGGPEGCPEEKIVDIFSKMG